MINPGKQKEEQNDPIHTWKHRDRYVEDYMAQNYDYLYNRTFFAKAMYRDFAKEIKNKLRKYLKDQQHEKVKEKRGTKKVLEIGCGTAIIANLLFTDKQINQTDDKVEVYCMDYSFKMLEIAKTRSQYFVESDMESLPFQESTFDIVYVHSALHHFPLLSNILREVKRILKPKGFFIIQEPCICNLKADLFLSYLTIFLMKIRTKKYDDLSSLELTPSDHHGPLSVKKLVSEIEESGFIIEDKQYKYYASYWLSHINSYFANSIGKILDKYYINKYSDGYLFLIVGQNK
jgi:Methylase involved in ubiquinone/menaquinone biosynthesis